MSDRLEQAARVETQDCRRVVPLEEHIRVLLAFRRHTVRTVKEARTRELEALATEVASHSNPLKTQARALLDDAMARLVRDLGSLPVVVPDEVLPR